MNKQELIKEYENIVKDDSLELCGCYNMADKNFMRKIYKSVLEDLERLDEPQEVEIPMFAADFIAEQKKLGHTLSYSIDACMSDGVAEWYWDNSELFVRAWLDGYTVEKEPKYTVKVKATKQYLSNDEIGPHFDPSFRSNFTKSDLEKLGLGWVFDCKGMEVEKVGK